MRHILQSGQQLGAADHLVSEALYFSDPDGNGIEVYHDRPSNLWQWENRQVSMTTDPLDANDILAEPDIAWQGLPEHTLMGHIHLHVSDLEEAEAFYVQGLGFRIATTYPGALFLSTADYHHHIGLNVWNGNGAKKTIS
ncbi:VOC family protein [Virgibacillus halophilus]|uniref:VOC family protein n=1 Tax=Tigheibacillus halophilus TaxID=361280 RepID=A0ABU5C8I4_9BACI|nr:VOC family protein [Virgibacillus halophilus]